jgi:hypothetical protein
MAPHFWHCAAPPFSPEQDMTETGFHVEVSLPFAWQPGQPDAVAQHGGQLLLRMVNLLDGHEAESDRDQDRLEARLDLMLHWLGTKLFETEAIPPLTPLRLMHGHIAWPARLATGITGVTLKLHVHPGMAAPLVLSGRIVQHGPDETVAELCFADGKEADAWAQWLFRQHRRAVQEARKRNGPE